jgi:MYXO-CTERM domain-containing protein
MILLAALAAFAAPHEAQSLQFGAAPRVHHPPARGRLPAPTPGPAMKVYGYLAYWDDDLNTVPWDDLTHLALFSVGANADGSLGSTGNWDQAGDALAMAAPYGVKIHLCITQFNPDYIDGILSSATNRNRLIDALVAEVEATGADGVNVDFEGMYSANKQDMVDFTRDLDAAVDEVVLATPAVDWSGAWDYSELSKYADLFIMGYGYHWGGSSEAGPNDPLFSGSGTAWSSPYSLAWTIDDYLYYGAVPERTILGLPLYGQWYDTAGSDYPTDALGGGDAVIFDVAWGEARTYGRLYDAGSETPYYFDGAGQTWYGDTDSVRERIGYARDMGIGGVGFWALNYVDDPGFWTMVGDEAGLGAAPPDTGNDGTDGTGGNDGGESSDGPWIADAGLPFLAYVGDTVILSALGSIGPEGADPAYEWTQVAGPPVTLDRPTAGEPSFRIESPGNVVFEVRVGDGANTWSAPARSYVVVIDPDAGERFEPAGCGCATGPAPPGWLAVAAFVAVRRRRK